MAVDTILILLNPFVPHITEELWEIIGNRSRLVDSQWPSYDENALKEEQMLIVVQVNGEDKEPPNGSFLFFGSRNHGLGPR